MHVIQDITGKLYDMNVVKQLYNLYKQYSDIREMYYLQDFSMLETSKTFNPKYIIRDMLTTYLKSVISINYQPDLLQKYTYTFYEEGNACKFEFSNNMIINNDIITLCYLYHMSYKCDFHQCETMQMLKSLMFNKYEICNERSTDDTNPTQQNKITLLDVALSFPSVTWDIPCNFEFWTNTFFDKFSDFNLPKIIFIPMMLSLLPQLKEEPPLAILLVVALRANKFMGTETYEKSLRTICNDISLSYEHKIFPERLKLEFCKKWQIVTIEKGIYKYTPYFAAHRQQAKDVIAKMKVDDPDLELILSFL